MGASRGIKQIFHPYSKWECGKNGMWEDVLGAKSEKMIELAVKFTSNHILYGEAMRKVIYTWKYSCENFLTDKNINRKAWLGHAACSLELNLPENIVRIAWKQLTDDQREKANLQAEKYIKEWEQNHLYKLQTTQLDLFDERRNREIRKKLGEKMLLQRDTRSTSKLHRKKNKSTLLQKDSDDNFKKRLCSKNIGKNASKESGL
jgi:hypothetical protein